MPSLGEFDLEPQQIRHADHQRSLENIVVFRQFAGRIERLITGRRFRYWDRVVQEDKKEQTALTNPSSSQADAPTLELELTDISPMSIDPPSIESSVETNEVIGMGPDWGDD